VGSIQINFFAVTLAVAMGTTAATLAALAPARAVAKVSVMDALAGRSGTPPPPGRVAGAGVLVLIAGAVLAVLGTQTDYDIPLVGGLIAMLSGFLMSIPLLVALVGRMASRLPMTGRLAARDAARHGRRTGAAVAAAAIALSLPVAVSTYSLGMERYESRTRSLGDHQLLIGELGSTAVGVALGGMDELVRDLRQEFPGANLVAVSGEAARDLGLEAYEGQYLMTAPAPLSSRDLDRADEIAAGHPGFYVVGDDEYLPRYALARTTATAASLPLALAIVAVAVALVASESRRSRQILVAVGAGPMSHRKLLATTSLLLALIAAVLAVPAALVPMVVVWAAASQSDFPFVIPWVTIGLVLVVIPLSAALVSGVVARTPKLGSLLTPTT
jgi:hypothetical protein